MQKFAEVCPLCVSPYVASACLGGLSALRCFIMLFIGFTCFIRFLYAFIRFHMLLTAFIHFLRFSYAFIRFHTLFIRFSYASICFHMLSYAFLCLYMALMLSFDALQAADV